MISAKSILSGLVALGVLSQIAKSELRLELVQVLFRHGERTPRLVEMYPNDPYNVSVYEPAGLGQLTNQGKMTEFRIGKMLRRRYDDYLGNLYRPKDVYARSTDVDRTKMSLLLTLAGLYPPTGEQNWHENVAWNPIPIRYIPEALDVEMKPHFCPIYKKVLSDIRKSPEVREKVAKFLELFAFLSGKTGLDIKEPSQVYELYNLLSSQRSLNMTIPDWCSDEVFKKIQQVVDLEYEIRSYTTQLKRLNGGMLIKAFLRNVYLPQNPRKIYLYSGHEINIAAFVRAHGLVEPKLPAYGSAVLFEKLRDDRDKLFIRMLLWTGVGQELVTYQLPGCDEICPFEKYIDIVKDVVPNDQEDSCLWNHISKEEIRKLFDDKISLD